MLHRSDNSTIVLIQERNDLLAVLSATLDRHVDPVMVRTWIVTLPDELVKDGELLQELEILLSDFDRRQMDVTSLSGLVLRVLYTADGCVQSRTAEARADDDWTELLTQWLQYIIAKELQVLDLFLVRSVVDVPSLCGGRPSKLHQFEMR